MAVVRNVELMCLSPERGSGLWGLRTRGTRPSAPAGEPPQCAGGRTTAPSVCARVGRAAAVTAGAPSLLFLLVLVVDVDADSGQQDDALDHLLVIDADAENGHAVVH